MRNKSAAGLPSLASCPFSPATALSGPERLVGIGFRCWIEGHRTGDTAVWETAWLAYAAALGPGIAGEALAELGTWVRLVRISARRDIEVYPAWCRYFCRDECLAVGLVAASQHGVCPAMNACAMALLDTASVDDVVERARGFALILRVAGQIVSPAMIANSLAAAPQQLRPSEIDACVLPPSHH